MLAGIRIADARAGQQVRTSTAGTDEAVLNLIVRGPDFLNKRKTFRFREGSGHGGDGSGGLQQVATGDVVSFCHEASFNNEDFIRIVT
jgi:hypothetical protein